MVRNIFENCDNGHTKLFFLKNETFAIFVIFEKMRYFCKIFDHCAPYVVAVSFDIYYGLVCVFYP